MKYDEFYVESIRDPKGFWKRQAQNLIWDDFPTEILREAPHGGSHWFADGRLNMSYLCIDRHLEAGHGDQVAIYYDSPVTQVKANITYQQLKDEVSKLAGGLKELGLEKGDTAIVYMPMIPQAIYAMLACAHLGVIHSVVFGGFAPHELAIRIDDCRPKVIITASNGVEISKIIPYKPFVDEAIGLAKHKTERVIIFDRKQGVHIPKMDYDVDYETLVNTSESVGPVSVESTHPLYILYTSGTTGTPKGIVRDTGGYATALKASMNYVYGVEEGDVYWAASDVGWVVGHSYIVYGPLLNRNTTILFEGKPIKTPDASTFWRIISEYRVKVMFTAPTAIRAIKKEDPEGFLLKKYDLSCLQYQFLAGERCDVATLKWTQEKLGIPVIDHWWQTESGWPMLANMVGVELQAVKPGSAGFPVHGYDVQIMDEDGNFCDVGEEGFVSVKLPLPPGCLLDVWQNTERFVAGYLKKFPGYYFSGDGGYRDEAGYVYITGRVDDIINVAGHRLSTAEMEEVVASHPAIAECAVFGIHCELKGQKPLGLAVLKSGTKISSRDLEEEIIHKVRREIGAVASFKQLLVVNRLPKTRSGKILRKLLRNIADKKEYPIPSTIDDVAIIDEVKAVYRTKNIGKFKKETL
nr:acetate--CoA ligase [uncultured Allomuricauda sp.]